MSDNEDFAFGDDWQAEAEAVIEQIKNEPSQPEPHQQDSPQTEEAPKEKPKVIDPKQALLARLAHSSALSDDKFEDYLEEVKTSSTNTEFKGSTQILKSDKDFAQFARAVGKRFNDQLAEAEADSLDESNVFQFVDQLLVLLYRGFHYQNFFHINKKLEAVMGERKKEEKQAKKRKQKQERQKKQQKLEQKQETNDVKKEQAQQEQDDIFGGATFVNSKQLQEERKNKEKAKVEAPPKPAEEDDDDFM